MGMILGFTGKFCAGKSFVIDYLTKKEFISHSTSGVLRDEMREKNIEITRDSLQETANAWRNERGAGVFGEKVTEQIQATPDFKNKNFTVDSIRHPDEVAALQKLPNFHLICVEAPIEMRYKRAVARKREQEHIESIEAFKTSEDKEMNNPDPKGQQIAKTIAMAKITLTNSFNTAEELYKEIDALLLEISNKNT